MELQASPTDALDSVRFRCSVCSQTFGKIQHLKRHTSTHAEKKPHICEFCGSEYTRSDALRRHWKNCTPRLESGHQVPQRTRSGKRKHACDRCTERKRACNQGNPCAECVLQGSECSYIEKRQRLSRSIEGVADPQGDAHANYDDESSSSKQMPSAKSQQLMNKIGIADRCHFDFLLKFTRATGINQGYNCNRWFMNDGAYEQTISSEDVSQTNTHPCCLQECPSTCADMGPATGLSSPARADLVTTALNVQSSHIYNMFLPFCAQGKESTATTADVISLFSPENVLHFIDIFWDRWYPHCLIFHRPTFDIECCPPLLLANMVLMGGCTSSYKADRSIARSLLDIAEKITFSQNMFSAKARLATGTKIAGPEDTDQSHLTWISTLQATYLICIMQKWEGTDESKIRIQRDQFTKFVSATRAMGLSRARQRHQSTACPFDDRAWRAWIEREEINRICNYVFLLDSAFVIFHNSFPRMALQEMQIDLTSPESWFQASSPTEFLHAVQSDPGLSEKNLSLVDSVRRLCNEDSTDFLDGASKLNLFTIATTLHGLIFHQKSSLYTLPLSENPLGKALDRLEVAWKLNQQRILGTHARHMVGADDGQNGFMQYADEFAILARISLELSYLSSSEMSELIEGLSENSSRGSFATFDQAGMGPVGDLMLALENMNLQK